MCKPTLMLDSSIKIHKTHTMEFRPCLVLECKGCMLCIDHNEEGLTKPCEGLTFPTTIQTGAKSNG